MRRLQIVWWGLGGVLDGENWRFERLHRIESLWGLGGVLDGENWRFERLHRIESLSKVYRWRLLLGPLEIRRWAPRARGGDGESLR